MGLEGFVIEGSVSFKEDWMLVDWVEMEALKEGIYWARKLVSTSSLHMSYPMHMIWPQ